MNTQYFFDYIEERLTWLSLRITSRGALNMYDINIHCEDFYMRLLNLLYGWNLVNANTIQRNSPAVDLIYTAKNIIVQVSSTNTTAKIQSSLDKLDTKYTGYNYKFVSIAKPTDKLKEHKFNTPSNLNIQFNAPNDIYDIDTLLVKIKSKSAAEMKEVYEFIKQELHFETEELKLETGLAHVINELSEIDLESNEAIFDTTTYDIDNKIIKNNLAVFKEVVEQYDVYFHVVQKIYEEFDKMGNNKSYAVLQTIRKEYLELKSRFSSDELYKAIAQNIKERLSLSANLKQFYDDDLELYVDIILVDAFIKCKIFEKP
ncbi:MAG: SMEK domain-containing protein [Bacteroidales bacterium]|nr:SMEK domain-containing protein [Bacteroidales bacterium]